MTSVTSVVRCLACLHKDVERLPLGDPNSIRDRLYSVRARLKGELVRCNASSPHGVRRVKQVIDQLQDLDKLEVELCRRMGVEAPGEVVRRAAIPLDPIPTVVPVGTASKQRVARPGRLRAAD